MLNSALETPFFLDERRDFGAANRRPREADQGHFYLVETAREYGGARQRDVRDAERLQAVASSEDGRQMRLRTPAIRCDRPTGQGSPAFSPAQCPRAGCQLILPQRTIRCDAKDRARPRKHLEQNTFPKRGVQVEHELPLVNKPVLFMARTRDRTAPGRTYAKPEDRDPLGQVAERAKELAPRMRDARVETFENVGHLLHLEATQRFHAALHRFLAE